jgi:hypothetical protein
MASDNLTLTEIEQYWLKESNEPPIPTIEQKAALIAWTFGEYSGPIINPFDGSTFRKLSFKDRGTEIILCFRDYGSNQSSSTDIFRRRRFLSFLFEKKLFHSRSSLNGNSEYRSLDQKLWSRFNHWYGRAIYEINARTASLPESLDGVCADIPEPVSGLFGSFPDLTPNPMHEVDDAHYLR